MSEDYSNYDFYVEGITCYSCFDSVQGSLIRGPLREKIREVDIEKAELYSSKNPKKITVSIPNVSAQDTQAILDAIKKEISEVGYACTSFEKSSPTNHRLRGILGCSAGFALLLLMLLAGPLNMTIMIPLGGLSVLFTLVLGADSYYKTWKQLRLGLPPTMDTLFTISTSCLIVVSILSFFIPWLPMMFETSLLIYGFQHLGIAIKNSLNDQIKPGKFQDRLPREICCIYSDGSEAFLKLESIEPGMVIKVNPNEFIPLDGLYEKEEKEEHPVLIYETIRTGRNEAGHFSSGSPLLAGMKLADNSAPLYMTVTKKSEDSYLARLDKSIALSAKEKQQEEGPIEKMTAQALKYFIPGAIATSLFSGGIVSLFFSPALGIQCGIFVLVAACPCILGLIIPSVINVGMDIAVQNGAQFQRAKIELLEQIDILVFDLHGTLLEGQPQVEGKIVPTQGYTEDTLIDLCYALESESTHAIGKAIFTYAKKKREGRQEGNIQAMLEKHRFGVTGQIDGATYAIGNKKLMSTKGIDLSALGELPELDTGSIHYIAKGQQAIGYLIIEDAVREDAQLTIDTLKAMDKEIHLCTGGDQETADRYAKKFGIAQAHVRANCPPIEEEKGEEEEVEGEGSKITYISKVAYIKVLKNTAQEVLVKGKMQKKFPKVAMVGDGENDAPAMGESDVGIAVLSSGGGANDDMVQKEAGLLIRKRSLFPLVKAFLISSQTIAHIKQNLSISFAYNLATLFLAGGFLLATGTALPPALGAVLMSLQACLVFANVHRFKHQPIEPLQVSAQPLKKAEKAHSPKLKESEEPGYYMLFAPASAPVAPQEVPSFGMT